LEALGLNEFSMKQWLCDESNTNLLLCAIEYNWFYCVHVFGALKLRMSGERFSRLIKSALIRSALMRSALIKSALMLYQ